ncbi:dicer-like protein 1 [Parachaetomium inaequale]|uniref:Dicer-like protein 1 n=1 Tax=Parachaetomium inaequale TaxID=2588326 RepID=A0AAN6PMB3_9PEZI|nr:dicer-like protein 1 [Parachaetomium inaequale]
MDVEMEEASLAPPQLQPSVVEDDLMDIDEPTANGASAEATATPEDDELANAEDTDREDDDGTKKWVVNPAPKPRKISERKRADNAAFDVWIEENQQDLSKGLDKFVVDDDKSFQSLIRDFENKRIITSPRDYQLELFELAKTQNTIAVLDTGSGKTLIAALLLRWTIQNELEDRSKGLPKRIAFFLVDKVALVFQQHAVLACNLDYPVEKFCGDMVEDVARSQDFWHKTYDNNMAIVCTAEILYQCLTHSYIRMDQINLLVFDEAHHTKKNHPYARIIKDFYAEVRDEKKRPRILGMTASPVDAQIDPKIAAAELEGLLHSQIATVADPTALQNSSAAQKREVLAEYDRSLPEWETELTQALKGLVGDHRVFQKPFAFTATATAELGPWCADRYWQLFFRGDEAVKLESKTERELLRQSAYSLGIGEHVNKVRQAHNLVNQHNFARPCPELLSPKVILLLRILRDQFRRADHNRRCIVFVRQRNIASLLADLLQQPEMQIPGLEPGVLVGGGRPEASYDNAKVTYREQVLTIIKFKKGELNCIFATSVAEEGLDIPDCNVIIRYDLNNTLIQYIQSRGRARQQGSIYIHMAEAGNPDHIRKLAQNKQSEDALRKFCEAMPEDRKLTGNNFNMDYFLRKEKGQRQYTVPETGAKLNYKQSLICLAAFVASLPHPPEVNLTADYVVLPVPGGYQCEVTLPDSSPIKRATGKIYASKAVAKCSAAFEVCLMLIKGKYLDQHLRPTFTKQLPAMRNARLAVSSKKKEQYKMRIKPEIWSALGEPTELYVMALTLADPAALDRQSSPLLLLTRQPMQRVASFPLYFGKNRSSAVDCVPVPGCVELDDSQIQGLTAFTLALFNDVFSKEYEATAAQLPYFLAPTRMEHAADFTSVTDTSCVVDWATVMFARENERIVCTFDEPDDFFTDKYVADPYDGSRKFFLRGRRHDMKPTDPVPEGIVAPKHRAWRITCKKHDILNYSLSAWSKSRTFMTLKEDQPVVEAEVLPIRRNLLDDHIGDDDLEPKPCFLVLEPLRISPLPVDVVAMAYNFPAIMHRIDSNLVALEACKMIGLNVRPDLALEAFTKDSDNTDEHDAEQVNFQSGMGNNYERLEFLGDCFLKMATTISIFTLIPDKAEFEYHVERMLLICNRNLFNNALEIKLEEYIRSMAFDRRSWYPEGLTLKRGKRKDVTRQHVLADKTIADVCEALIGAAYLTAQEQTPPNFDLAIRAVTIMVKDKNHAMTSYPDYYAAYVPPAWQTAPCNSTQLDMASRFEARMGYAFTHPRLLRSAFQHPTYPSVYEKLPSYQRLEFLGDALLDMASVEFLFHRFPGADPQWLTEHKMAMVSNQFLGCLAVCLGFHKAITYCSAAIQKEIAEYVAEIEDALDAAKTLAITQGKPQDEYARDFWVRCGRPPKCLPDVVEAYVGAVFVDSRYDFETVRRFFADHVRPFFEDMRLYDAFANKHPVTFLAGVMQGRMGCAEWRLLVKELAPYSTAAAVGGGEEGGLDVGAVMASAGNPQVVCAVRVHGLTLAHAVAASSRYGKIAAAKRAIKVLEGMGVDEFRRAYGCACKLDAAAAAAAAAAVGKGGQGQEEIDHGSAI